MLISFINRRLATESNVNFIRKLADDLTFLKKTNANINEESTRSVLELLDSIEVSNSVFGNPYISYLSENLLLSYENKRVLDLNGLENLLFTMDGSRYKFYNDDLSKDREWFNYYLTTPNLETSENLKNFCKNFKRKVGTNTLRLDNLSSVQKILSVINEEILLAHHSKFDLFFLNCLKDRVNYVHDLVVGKNEEDSYTLLNKNNVDILEKALSYLTSQKDYRSIDSRVWSILLWHSNKHSTEFTKENKIDLTEVQLLHLSEDEQFSLIKEKINQCSGQKWPSWKALEGDFISLGELLGKETPNWDECISHLKHIESQSIDDDKFWNPATFFIEIAKHFQINISGYQEVRQELILRLALWKEALLKRDILELSDWINHAQKFGNDSLSWLRNEILFSFRQNILVLSEISKEVYNDTKNAAILCRSISLNEISNAIDSMKLLDITSYTLIDNALYFSGLDNAIERQHLEAINSEGEVFGITVDIDSSKNIFETIDQDYLKAILSDAKDMYGLLQESVTQIYKTQYCDESLARSIHSLKSLSLSLGDEDAARILAKAELWATRLNETSKRISDEDISNISLIFTAAMMVINSWFKSQLSNGIDKLNIESALGSGSSSVGSESYVSVFEANKLFPNEGDLDFEIDEPDLSILESFKEEAQDIFNKLDDSLISDVKDNLETINNLLHTLKGGARISGLMKLGAWVHQIEDLTTKKAKDLKDNLLTETLQYAFDKSRAIFSSSLMLKTDDESTLKEIVLKVPLKEMEEISESLLVSESSQKKVQSVLGNLRNVMENSKEPSKRLKKLAGDIYIEAESLLNAGKSKKKNNSLFDELEFDKFTYFHELTRKLEEAVSDSILYNELIEQGVNQIDDFTNLSKSWLNSAQKDLLKKLYSEAKIYESRLSATVRSAGSELKKVTDIFYSGSNVWVDKKILDEVIPALEHIVRNSVAHSIEMPDQRILNGKPMRGRIEVSVQSASDKFIFTIKDDGSGLNFEKIKEKALQNKLINSELVTNEELCDVIFKPGFSTASSISNTAGRGVGLDAVKDMVSNLGGKIEIKLYDENKPEFIIEVPMSSWLLSGIKLVSNEKSYVIDGSQIRAITTINNEKVKESLSNKFIENEDSKEPCIYMDYINGNYDIKKINRFHPVIHLHNGRAIIGDQIEFVEKQPVKPLPYNIFRDEGITGTTILSDSNVGVVIDVLSGKWESLFDIAINKDSVTHTSNSNLIMVVDDSLTIRKISEKFLRKNGFDFVSAENGLEAIKYLENNVLPAFILMDIEMPVMDGFEAIKRIKQLDYAKDIPVVFISSRAVDKHINYAKSIGALDFLGKPFNEEKLLAILKSAKEVANV